MLETLELKLEVGLGAVTKSVVAMCLTGLTADIQNWSSNVNANLIASYFKLTVFRLSR